MKQTFIRKLSVFLGLTVFGLHCANSANDNTNLLSLLGMSSQEGGYSVLNERQNNEPSGEGQNGLNIRDVSGVNLPGWPKPGGEVIDRYRPTSMITGDFDEHPGKEVAVVSYSSDNIEGTRLSIFSQEGELIFSYISYGQNSEDFDRTPAVGNFDNDPYLEIALPVGFGLNVYNNRRTKLVSTANFGHQAPVFAKLNPGESNMNLIAIDKTGRLHAWLPVGWPNVPPNRAGFPVQLVPEAEYANASSLAVGDITGDGQLEIVVQVKKNNDTSAPILFAVKNDGSILWQTTVGNDYSAFAHTNANTSVLNDLALADVNNDGALEIVYFRKGGTATQDSELAIFDRYGQKTNSINLPTTLANFFSGPVNQSLTLGELDTTRPGLEIVMIGHAPDGKNSRLFAWDKNLNLLPGFPVEATGVFYGFPMLADVNGNGSAEIVLGSGAQRDFATNPVYAYDYKGQAVAGWPLLFNRIRGDSSLATSPYETITIDDVNEDGILDLLVPTIHSEYHIRSLPAGPGAIPRTKIWAQYRGNAQRTGRYDGPVTLPVPPGNFSGWPAISREFPMEAHVDMTVGDVDPAPGKEVVTIKFTGGINMVQIFAADGNRIGTYRQNGSLANRTPALGNIDNDPYLEIAVAGEDGVLILDSWNSRKHFIPGNFGHAPPVFAKLDTTDTADALMNLVAIDKEGKLHAWSFKTGNPVELPGFPVDLKGSEYPAVMNSPLAVGDLNGDGHLEIAVAIMHFTGMPEAGSDDPIQATPTVYTIQDDGSILWKYKLRWTIYERYDVEDTHTLGDLIMADLSQDGDLQVIYFNKSLDRTRKHGFVLVLEYDGYREVGVQMGFDETDFLNGPQNQSLAVGDLDSSIPGLEMVLVGKSPDGAGSRIFAWNQDNLLPGFPVDLNGVYLGFPMIADVDGQGDPEIVLGSANQRDLATNPVYAFDSKGQAVSGWPLHLNREVDSNFITLAAYEKISIADLNGDGVLDLLSPIGGWELHVNSLFVSPLYIPRTTHWPEYRGNAQRTGRYDGAVTLP